MDRQILRELHRRQEQAVLRQVQARHAQVRVRHKSPLQLRRRHVHLPLQRIRQEPLRQHAQTVLRQQARERHVQRLRKSLERRITASLHQRERHRLHEAARHQAQRKATAANRAAVALRQAREVTRRQAVADRAAVRLHVQVTQAHRIRVHQVRQDRVILAALHVQEVHLLTHPHQEDSWERVMSYKLLRTMISGLL